MLPAGRLEGNPSGLVANGNVTHTLQRLQTEYPYIVIDTPPLLDAGEALVFAKAVGCHPDVRP